jgi:hypothetical protein
MVRGSSAKTLGSRIGDSLEHLHTISVETEEFAA